MRVSIDQITTFNPSLDDIGIYLDGNKVEGVLWADTDKGMLEMLGYPHLNPYTGEIVKLTKQGNVEIRIGGQN